jgi:hypothetical protein
LCRLGHWLSLPENGELRVSLIDERPEKHVGFNRAESREALEDFWPCDAFGSISFAIWPHLRMESGGSGKDE